MKHFLITLFASFAFSFAVQSQNIEGTYTNTWESEAGGALTYTLTLHSDSTFQFVSHRVFETSIPSKTITADGTWNNNNRLLILATEVSSETIDLVEKLNKNKAKYKAYPPRHRKFKLVKPSLKFYESEVFYAKGMKLFKEENDIHVTGS